MYWIYSRCSKCNVGIRGTLDVLDIFAVLWMCWIYSRHSRGIGYIRDTLYILDIRGTLNVL